MLIRIWRVQIDLGRAGTYAAFAESRSKPMFASIPGCLGALFLGAGAERAVVTIWQNMEAITSAEQSSAYRETVDALVATGVLAGDQAVEVWPITDYDDRLRGLFAT